MIGGKKFMKKCLKALMALLTIGIGLLLGIILLVDFVWWKIILFGMLCHVTGHLVYKVLRVIDDKFAK